MKKKGLIMFIFIIAFLAYGIYWDFFDMNRLPKGELISEVQSPNEIYTIKAYLTNGGATSSYAIRGELNFNNSKKSLKIFIGIIELRKRKLNGLMMIQL